MKMSPLWLLASASILVSCNSKTPDITEQLARGQWIDLSYSFSEETLYWPNNPTGFKLDTLSEGTTPAGFYYSSFSFNAPEHGGTHLDAPLHFAANRLSADQLRLDQLTGGAIVIDVSEKALKDRDYLISIDDVLAWEKKHDTISSNNMVLFRTGYGQFYPDAEKYFGTSQKGAEAIALLHFPGIAPELAEWLVKRKVKAVGIDTPSIDYGQSKDFKTHQILMGADIPAFENMANLDQLPETGTYIVALPMKIKNGSGAPLRVIGWVKK